MARYTYHGPVQTIALAVSTSKDKDGNQVSKFKDFEFKPDKETADLPEGSAVVKGMIALKALLPLEPEKAAGKPPATETKTAKTASTNKGDK